MKKALIILQVLLLSGIAFPLNAQKTTCGSEIILNQMMKDENFIQKQLKFEQSMALRSQQRILNNTVYTIPVVVHVIHLGESVGVGTNISDAQIQSAIDNLTTVYRGNNGLSTDTHIEFQLAQQDANCNATTGIVRVDGRTITDYETNGITLLGSNTNQAAVKGLSYWPNELYYNIWVVSKIEGSDGTGIQGFAPLPNGTSSATDGMAILYNTFGFDENNTQGFNLKSYTNQNKVAVHEMGHGLNLFHTFTGDKGLNDQQAESCPADVNGCVTFNSTTNQFEYRGDCCADTPRHKQSETQCSPLATNSCDTGVSLEPSIRNFMSYSAQSCQIKFTPNQRERMRQAIETLRPSLISSKGDNDPIAAPTTTASTPTCTPATQPTGLNSFFTGIKSVQFGTSVSNLSGYPSQDSSTGYTDVTANCMQNYELTAAGSVPLTVELYFTNNNYVKSWIDYDNNGEFDSSEMVMNLANRNENNSATTTVTIPSGLSASTQYRMRVICDLNPITDACTSPRYGQVEDYGARFGALALNPVELISFSGKNQQHQIILNWKTASETDNSHFKVERSANGIHFEEIAKVQPSPKLNYEWIDKKPIQGTNYYRLSQTDVNGQSQIIGHVLSFKIVNKSDLILVKNPILKSENISIQILSHTNEFVNIHLFDINGKILHSEKKQIQKGNNNIQISPMNLPKGIYLLQANFNNHTFTKKIISQ